MAKWEIINESNKKSCTTILYILIKLIDNNDDNNNETNNKLYSLSLVANPGSFGKIRVNKLKQTKDTISLPSLGKFKKKQCIVMNAWYFFALAKVTFVYFFLTLLIFYSEERKC